MQLISADEEGNIIILYDSRWQYPELLGYGPDDPIYHALRELHHKMTGAKKEEKHDRHNTDQEAGD